MPDIDAVLRPRAREFYENIATPTERENIDEAIRAICRDPAVDNRLSFVLSATAAEPEARIYNDRDVWLIYRMLNEWTLEVLGIGTVEDRG